MPKSRKKMLYTRVGNDPVLLAVMAEINRSAVKPPKGYLTRDQWAAKWKLKAGHTASIYINDKLVHTTPMQGGSNDHYLTLATDWLRRQGYLEGLLDEREPIWYLRDKRGIDLQYGAVDVRRERDL
jgi:hypothetical protein